MNPNICNNNDTIIKLSDEPGMGEFEKLYFDIFDANEGKYTSMSEKAKIEYNKNLKEFYKEFINKPFNNDITSFADIKLHDYKMDENCKNGVYKKIKEQDYDDVSFKEYAKRLNVMINNMINRQNELITVLNKVFTINKKSEPKIITINTKLTMASLDKLIITTKNLIKNLYIGCEQDFKIVLNVYFELLDLVTKKTEINQKSNLEKISELNKL